MPENGAVTAPQGQRTDCDDSDAPAGNGLPAEVPHPPMPNEDRCEQHLDAWLRWAERERKAAARKAATGHGRDPLPYVKYPRAPRWRSVVLTRAETDEIDEAVTAVATRRAQIAVAANRHGATSFTPAQLRPLLSALDGLLAALAAVNNR